MHSSLTLVRSQPFQWGIRLRRGKSEATELDGDPHVVTLMSNGTRSIGKLQVPGAGAGSHTVEMVDPAGCFAPVTFSCTVSASPDAEWDELWAEYETLESYEKNTALLLGNYPNPFNPSTTIRYALNTESHVTLGIYNMLGELVTMLVDAQQVAGSHEVTWDGRNSEGSAVSSGAYIYRITTDGISETRRILLTK